MIRFLVCLFPALLFWWTPIVTVLPVLEARPVTVVPTSPTHGDEHTSVSPDGSYWTESVASTTVFPENFTDHDLDWFMNNSTTGNSSDASVVPAHPSNVVPLYVRIIIPLVSGLFVIVGTIGNGLVILAFCSYRQVRTSAHTFILSISISDIMMTGFHYPTGIVSMIIGAPAFGETLCPIQGALFFISIYVSFLSMVLIAFNRCMHITKSPSTYRKLFTPVKSFLWVLLSWVVAGLLLAPGFLGYGEFGWSKYQVCSITHENPYSAYYMASVFGISYWVVFFVVAGIYARIYFFVKDSVVTMAAANQNLANPKQYVSKRVIKQTKHMFIIFSAFTACTAPVFVIYGIRNFLSREVIMMLLVLYSLNHVMNPFLYAWKLRVFRRAFKALVSCKRQLPFQAGNGWN
ncbi:PREDICTED: alpha-1A adrenergic receptor-like [Branchiostoma belcheri]|uniref:Alpha-1A adrenergic receptor-like n=1 Tax=Branchiostoma belcheri TaxID=7741 RepID=A0A6P4ZN66_BRABE|nr:PREDICTED: alpha-1A adrenergic receptor-like [Branchiostoma belcheri]